MKIFIGSDHRGFAIKSRLQAWLTHEGHTVIDKGPFAYDQHDDYPDFIAPVAKAVENDPAARGIVLGFSGEGEAIVANRFPGIRAAVYYGGPLEIVRLSRRHNDANVLSLGTDLLTLEQMQEAIGLWLHEPYEGGRHEERLEKIDHLHPPRTAPHPHHEIGDEPHRKHPHRPEHKKSWLSKLFHLS